MLRNAPEKFFECYWICREQAYDGKKAWRTLSAVVKEWKWPRRLWRPSLPNRRPWLIDRDGRIYLPDRRVELKAK